MCDERMDGAPFARAAGCSFKIALSPPPLCLIMLACAVCVAVGQA